jgi:transketolase
MRGHRGNTPVMLDPAQYQFEIGKTYLLRGGSGIGVIASGHASQWALEASDMLEQQGVDHSLLHVPTIKPVNEDEIAAFCFNHEQIVTVENHQIVTGLGSLVAEIVSDIGRGPRITRIGIPNRWAPGGTLPYIRSQLSLDATQLARRIKAVLA